MTEQAPARCGHGLAASVLPGDVVVLEGPVEESIDGLYPEEIAHLSNARDRRRHEFATARRLARRALHQLGGPVGPLVPRPDRSPVWPRGFVGSITHTRAYCAVAVGKADQRSSIGLDIEEVDRVTEKLERLIVLPGEVEAWVATGRDRNATRALLFSAKEAFYKYQHPLTGRLLGFHDVRICPAGPGAFRVEVVDAEDADLKGIRAHGLEGRFAQCCGLVATACAIERRHPRMHGSSASHE